MQLPRISKLFQKHQKEDHRPFRLAVQIGTKLCKGAVWQDADTVTIQKIFQGSDPEMIVHEAQQQYPIKHIIFGLPDEYVEQNTIKESYLPTLKKLAESSGLTPLGFVVIPEAIAHLLEAEQETPPTAILLGIEDHYLTFSLFRVGKCVKTVRIERRGNLFHDFEEGLIAFANEEILPSKIILYDEGKSLQAVREQFLTYPWQKNDKFLHVPKIETLPLEFSMKAVVHAGISELENRSVHISIAPDALQILPQSPPVVETELEPMPVNQTETPFGFVAERDIVQEEALQPSFVTTEEQEVAFSKPSLTTPKKPQPSVFPRFSLPRIALPFSFTSFPLRVLLPAILILFFILSAGAGVIYWYPKVTLTLIANPQILDRTIAITLNTSLSEPDITSKQIPGKIYTVTVSGEKAGATTGKKIIGEKATGSVIVYNKTAQQKTFPKGTVLAAQSDLTFTLNDEVSVASASDTGESLTYGKTAASVTAVKIGPKGNIKGETEFTVAESPTSTITIKNEGEFSGGTEREVAVVSKADQETLLKEMLEQIKSQAQQQLQTQIRSDERSLDQSLHANIVEKKFDKDIGGETDNLAVSLTAEFSQTTYREEDISRFLTEYMKGQIPEGYTFDPGKGHFRVISTEATPDGNITFSALYRAFLLPTLNLDEFKKTITGHSRHDVESQVNTLVEKNIIGYELTYERKPLLFSDRLPFRQENIEVTLKPY